MVWVKPPGKAMQRLSGCNAYFYCFALWQTVLQKSVMILSSQCNIKLFPGTFLTLLFGKVYKLFRFFFPLKVSKKMKNRRLHHLHQHHESHLERKSFRRLSSLWKGLTLFRCCHLFPQNIQYDLILNFYVL